MALGHSSHLSKLGSLFPSSCRLLRHPPAATRPSHLQLNTGSPRRPPVPTGGAVGDAQGPLRAIVASLKLSAVSRALSVVRWAATTLPRAVPEGPHASSFSGSCSHGCPGREGGRTVPLWLGPTPALQMQLVLKALLKELALQSRWPPVQDFLVTLDFKHFICLLSEAYVFVRFRVPGFGLETVGGLHCWVCAHCRGS